MKSFLEEYGFAILSTIVVILIILMISPIGIKIKDSFVHSVSNFSEIENQVFLDSGEKLDDLFSSVSGDDNTSERVCYQGYCENELYFARRDGNEFFLVIDTIAEDSVTLIETRYYDATGSFMDDYVVSETLDYEYIDSMFAIYELEKVQSSFDGTITNSNYFVPLKVGEVIQIDYLSEYELYVSELHENGEAILLPVELNEFFAGKACGTDEEALLVKLDTIFYQDIVRVVDYAEYAPVCISLG